MMHDMIKPRRSPGSLPEHALGETLGENPTTDAFYPMADTRWAIWCLIS